MKLDTQRPRSTPEGVELSLRVAGPAVRFYAALIDYAVVSGVITAAAVLFQSFGGLGMGVSLLVIFAFHTFYPIAFEVLRGGATIGKRALGLAVVSADGTPVRPQASFIRNLLRPADFLPAFYGLALVTMLIDRDFRRLGDIVAGTVVVHRDSGVLGFGVPAADPVPPPLPLRLAEQRAIVDYWDRHASWTPERSRELADVLEPLTGETGDRGVQRLLGYANWQVGRR